MRAHKTTPALMPALLIGLLCGSAGVRADIFKCVAANGEVTYRDSPCPDPTDTLEWQRAEVVLPSSAVLPAVEPARVSARRMESGDQEASFPDWLRPPDAARRQQILQAVADRWPQTPPLWLLVPGIYALMSVLCFFTYWHDKRAAQANRRRVPEKTLHWQEFLGGWPGALLAQRMFRHKTIKNSYRTTFHGIIAVHVLLWLVWLVTVCLAALS